MKLTRKFLVVPLFLGLAALPADAQTPAVTAGGLQMTRAQLEAQLSEAERLSASAGGRAGQEAATQAALLRQRLQEGDLQVGDRVALNVVGYPQMSDTFTVAMGRVLVVPEAGEIPLQGVLRSELQQHLTQQIGRVLRDPVVRAQPLIRLEVRGAVGRPGFYTLAADMLLSDVIMFAGGPARNAGLDQLRIVRGTETLWSRDQTRSALVEGLTLDQLNVRAGDRIEIPENRSWGITARNVLAIASGIASAIWIFQRVR